MNLIKVGQVCGQWKYEREINRGGFGVVLEFKNIDTNEQLVIKRCLKELSNHTRERWMEELKLMNSTQHKNLVQGRLVPHEIKDALRSPEELLGLEYCDSDLRKVLHNSAYCCGLPEHMVIDILRDISSGLKFLHDKKIIHRDLKPENILLRYRETGTVFKIADLGYAKQLEGMSIAQSFVGTLQYLAPELYNDHREYKITVDLWSFGTLLFECITGFRPFNLTDSKFIEWAKKVATKLDTDIWGSYEKPRGPIRFSSDIPEPNHICAPLLSRLKIFLQSVLQHDPKKRGGQWYNLAQDVWELKVIKVLDIYSCTLIPYEFNSNETVMNLKTYIYSKQSAVINDQMILDSVGNLVKDNELLLTYYTRTRNLPILYLFEANKRCEINDLAPDRVRELLGSSNDMHEEILMKKCLAQAFYYCNKILNDYKCLDQASKCLMKHVQEDVYIEVTNILDELKKYSVKLETVIEVYETSYKFDKEKHIDQLNCTDDVLNELEKNRGEIKNFSGLLKFRDDILKEMVNFQGQIDKYLPLASPEKRRRFEDLSKSAQKEYEKFKSSRKEDFKRDMVISIVMGSITEKGESFKTLYDKINGVMKTRKAILTKLEKTKQHVLCLEKSYRKMLEFQLTRQDWLWRLFEGNSSANINKESAFLKEIMKTVDSADTDERSNIQKLSNDFNYKLKVMDAVLNGKKMPEPPSPLHQTKKLWKTFDVLPSEKEIDFSKRRTSEPPDLNKLSTVNWNHTTSMIKEYPEKEGCETHSVLKIDKKPLANIALPECHMKSGQHLLQETTPEPYFHQQYALKPERDVSSQQIIQFEQRPQHSVYDGVHKLHPQPSQFKPLNINICPGPHLDKVVLEQQQGNLNASGARLNTRKAEITRLQLQERVLYERMQAQQSKKPAQKYMSKPEIISQPYSPSSRADMYQVKSTISRTPMISRTSGFEGSSVYYEQGAMAYDMPSYRDNEYQQPNHLMPRSLLTDQTNHVSMMSASHFRSRKDIGYDDMMMPAEN